MKYLFNLCSLGVFLSFFFLLEILEVLELCFHFKSNIIVIMWGGVFSNGSRLGSIRGKNES